MTPREVEAGVEPRGAGSDQEDDDDDNKDLKHLGPGYSADMEPGGSEEAWDRQEAKCLALLVV